MPWLTPAMLAGDADMWLPILEAISPAPIAAAEKLVQVIADNPTAAALICQIVNAISGATPPTPTP